MKRFFLVALCVFPLLVWGKSSFWDANFNPLEEVIFGEGDNTNVLENLLIISFLTNQESVALYASKARDVLKEIQSQNYKNESEKAEALLKKIHQYFLKRYRESANTVSGIFITGEFNCMSSSLLYAALAREMGLQTRLNLYRTHARPEVLVNGMWIEVEATSPFGYDFRRNTQAQQEFVRLTTFSNEGRILAVCNTPRQWYAAWYANEVYFQFKQGKVPQGFQLALRSFALDPSLPIVQTNSVSAYQEYTSFLLKRGLTNEVIAVIEEGVNTFPFSPVLSNNYQFIVYQNVLDTLKRGNLADGKNLLKKYRPLLLTQGDMMGSLYQELLYRLIMTNAYQEAWDTLEAVQKEFGEKSWFVKVSAYGLSSLVKKLVDDWKSYPAQEKLVLRWYTNLASQDKSNYLVEYYNNIGMAYYQAGFSQKALEVWQKGLIFVPNASIVRQNLAAWYTQKANGSSSAMEKLSFYQKALEYTPDNWELDRAILLSYRAVVEEFVDREDWQSVLKYAEEGLGRYPNDKQLQYYRDYAKKKIGK